MPPKAARRSRFDGGMDVASGSEPARCGTLGWCRGRDLHPASLRRVPNPDRRVTTVREVSWSARVCTRKDEALGRAFGAAARAREVYERNRRMECLALIAEGLSEISDSGQG